MAGMSWYGKQPSHHLRGELLGIFANHMRRQAESRRVSGQGPPCPDIARARNPVAGRGGGYCRRAVALRQRQVHEMASSASSFRLIDVPQALLNRRRRCHVLQQTPPAPRNARACPASSDIDAHLHGAQNIRLGIPSGSCALMVDRSALRRGRDVSSKTLAVCAAQHGADHRKRQRQPSALADQLVGYGRQLRDRRCPRPAGEHLARLLLGPAGSATCSRAPTPPRWRRRAW